MSGIDELYRAVILDHFRHPRNQGKIDPPALHAETYNPLCGDVVNLYLAVNDGRITDVRFEGTGCSISQSSISMMTEKIKGLSISDVQALAHQFRALIRGDDSPQEGVDLGEMEVLKGVTQYPARIKCALLGWDSLNEALNQSEESH